MTPIIRSKADRERVRKWLSDQIERYERFGSVVHGAVVSRIRTYVCGPASKPKPRKRNKR